jgi:hypothetical protein
MAQYLDATVTSHYMAQYIVMVISHNMQINRLCVSDTTGSEVMLWKIVIWDVVTRGSCYNRRFGERCRLHLQGRKIRELRATLAVTSRVSNWYINGKVSLKKYKEYRKKVKMSQ